MKSKKLRDAARGQQCTLEIHPYCNHNPLTTSPCHIRVTAGWGQTEDDFMIVHGCSACHDVIDGRVQTDIEPVEIEQIKIRALHRTWTRLITDGLITIAGLKLANREY